MSQSNNALITVQDIKDFWNIKGSEDDPMLETLIESVSTMFNQYLNRTLANTAYSNLYLDGPEVDTQNLYLPNWPVGNISALNEDGTALIEGAANDYLLYAENGLLWRVDRVWVQSRSDASLLNKKAILISYTAGYITSGNSANLPADIKLACFQQVAAEYQRYKTKSFREVSRSYPDGSVSYEAAEGLLPNVKKALNNYRRFKL